LNQRKFLSRLDWRQPQPICYGCRSSDTGEDSCEAKTTWSWIPTYGCGYVGPGTECSSCNNGSCDFTNCVGFQCNCGDGQICDANGICQNEAPPTCNQLCQGVPWLSNRGGCYNPTQCTIRGGIVDGNSSDCTAPRVCCCFY